IFPNATWVHVRFSILTWPEPGSCSDSGTSREAPGQDELALDFGGRLVMRMVVTKENPEPSDQVRRVLLGMGLECGAADCVPFHEIPVRLAQGPVDLVLVRMGAQPDAALSAIRQTATLTGAPILALGPTSDAQRILQTSRFGAREYLDECRLQEDLEAALQKLRQTGSVHNGQGSVVTVVSPAPGSGVTTV